jgi:hypothetical protein
MCFSSARNRHAAFCVLANFYLYARIKSVYFVLHYVVGVWSAFSSILKNIPLAADWQRKDSPPLENVVSLPVNAKSIYGMVIERPATFD